MKMNGLISRAAAIDALTDENIEKNFDSVYDGELHRTKRAAMRIIANMPIVAAIPVEWLESKRKEALHEGMRPDEVDAVEMVLWMWQKEQEAR